MERFACSVLEKHRERLKSCGVDPARLVLKLPAGIEDEDVKRVRNPGLPASQRWEYLVTAIMKSSKEGLFQKFIEVLLREREMEELGREMKDTYMQRRGVSTKQPKKPTDTYMQRRGVLTKQPKKPTGTPSEHFLINGRGKTAMSHIPSYNGPKESYAPSSPKNQVVSKPNHSEQASQDHSGGVEDVVRTVTSWNRSTETMLYTERLKYLGTIKKKVAQASLNPLKWPNTYLSQPALLRFLRLVVDNCIQHTPTAEIKVALKEVLEPIDLDTVENLPFRKHISKWVYGTENLPICMNCENMMSLHKYFQYALDHLHGGSWKDDPLGVLQPDISGSVTTALSKAVCCFTNHLRKTGQKYEEIFVVTSLLPFKYDPEQQTFLSTISARDVEYLCKKFGHYCKQFFEVIKQHDIMQSQVSLLLLALKMHNNFHMSNSQMKACLQYIEHKIGKDIDPQVAQMLLQQHSHNYEWAWLQSQLESVTSHIEKMKHLFATPCEDFFSVLGLSDFYPQKLTLHHALEIREDTLESVRSLQDTGRSSADKKPMKKATPCRDPQLYPFLILQKIMAFDYKCRTKCVLSSQLCSDQCDIVKILSKNKRAKDVTELFVHPMDGLLAVLHCADNFLRQDLMSRLATCQIAVPLLLPDPFEPDNLTFPIWAMRSIVREWQLPNGSSKEGQLVSYPSPLVSFLRIGRCKKSKSYMMNIIISESKHDIFFHYNCDGGDTRQLLRNGLVEVCWYLPPVRDRTFSDLITFANLHGDAQQCPKQVKFLSEVSFMNFVFISKDNRKDEALEVLKTLAAAPGGIVILQVDCSDDDGLWYEWLEPISESVEIINLAERSEATFLKEVQEEINERINQKWNNETSKFSLERGIDVAHQCDILVDEDEEHCMEGMKLANTFQRIVQESGGTHRAKSLKTLLPLQSSALWQKWASAEKEQYRQSNRGQCEIELYCQQQRQIMRSVRNEQLYYVQNANSLTKTFLTSLLNHQGKTRHYFLQWIQLFLNNLSRHQLPDLHNKYKHKVLELQGIQSRNEKDAEKNCQAEIQELNKQMIDASFGLEHLLREVSQIYDAVAAQRKVPQKDLHFLRLPEVAAELMIEGYPLELMDGDAAHVPMSWVSAVLSKVQEILKNPRLFVLSVLGIQSSGKSTLMNTVFGVRFSTSAGRCTRGAFMQLLPIHSSLRQECNCDYFLIVDTEGLRAPELAQESLKHDNELATFVIGLANLTIINLSGETAGDMDDILQTTVHAFLRMKAVELKSSCHFVHQNVPAVNARDKTMMGRMKFKDELDKKTQAAAKEEGLEDKYQRFTDVINFDSTNHVFIFPNLWKGEPPMDPINQGYSTSAQFLKLCLIAHAKTSCSNHLEVLQRHFKALWRAILYENFIFSFKNTLEAIAYNTLDCTYSTWSWEFKQEMMTWEHKEGNTMKSCDRDELQSCFENACSKLPEHVKNIHERLKQKLDAFFECSAEQEIIIQWRGKMESRLTDLAEQLETRAKKYCIQVKDSRQAFAEVDDMEEKYSTQVLNDVKRVASQLEKGKLNDEQLEKRFDETWALLVKDIKSRRVHKEFSVQAEVENCITSFEPLKRLSNEMLLKQLGSTPLKNRGLNLQLTVETMHVKLRQKYYGLSSEYPVKQGQRITDDLLQHQRWYIQQMEKRHYNPNLATELLHRLFADISSHSTEDTCTFTEKYKFDMALTVCGYAVLKFQKMVDTEKKENDPVEYLERKMRSPFLKIFKDEYNQIAREVTTASAVCSLLQHSVKQEVITSLSQRIVRDMVKKRAFLKSKKALKAKILLDIGDKLEQRSEGHIEDTLLYLTDVKKSLYRWLRWYTIQYCGEGYFLKMANEEISHQVMDLTRTTSAISQLFLHKQCKFEITEWLTAFHSHIKSSGNLHLKVRELYQLGGVYQLKNISHFTQEVKNGLAKVESVLKKEFANMPMTEMDNWTTKPFDNLFEALAGCTKQCPFCKEQCDETNPNHCPSTKDMTSTDRRSSDLHSVAMHRPECLGRYRWNKSKKMVLDICTTSVGTKWRFKNADTGGEYRSYKAYRDIYPEWHIPVDISVEASVFWKWVLGNFATEISQEFGMEETDIFEEWKDLQWNDVQEELKEIYSM